MQTAKHYLAKPPRREDILSVFTGVRPLVKSADTKNTSKLSRDYAIEVDESYLLTVTGGKWTTYRKMAEDAVDEATKIAGLTMKISMTKDLRIHGYSQNAESFGDLAVYGEDAKKILLLIAENSSMKEKFDKDLPYSVAEIVWAARFELAQTVEDALARRTRALFLDASAAVRIAPKVAEIMARELGKNDDWIAEQLADFNKTAENFLPVNRQL